MGRLQRRRAQGTPAHGDERPRENRAQGRGRAELAERRTRHHHARERGAGNPRRHDEELAARFGRMLTMREGHLMPYSLATEQL